MAREMWSAVVNRVGAEPTPGRRPRTLAFISIPGPDAGAN